MKHGHCTAVCVIAAALSLWVTPAFAYLGPGVGLSAIGAFLALVLGVLVAFFGFIWYPLRRLWRKGKAAGASASAAPQKPPVESVDRGI